MSLVKRNLVATFIGTGCSGLFLVGMVPVYLHFLGVEAYALFGFGLSLQAIATLMDLGLATTVNRELARFSVDQVPKRHSFDVVRTAEILYWSVSVAMAFLLYTAAPLLATRWFHLHDLPLATVTTSLRFIAIATAVRFPFALYSAALFGLQKHVVLNVVLCAATSIRAAGTIILLMFIARDIRVVFAWEMAAGFLLTAATAVFLHDILRPGPYRARFDRSALRDGWKFTIGVGIIGILAAVTTQVDKLAVSRLLPLRVFGYYSIATTLATTVLAIVTPISVTIFPRFSQLVAQGNERALAAAYHRASETLAAILLPIAGVICFCGRDIVTLWTGDPVAALETQTLIVLLVSGAALNALMSVPYMLQLAYAWTTPALLVNGIGVVLLIPAAAVATEHYGAIGAATCWLLFHFTSFVIGMAMTHGRYLRGHRGRWLWRAVILPAAVSIAVCGAARPFISSPSRGVLVVMIGTTAVAALIATALSTPTAREWIAERRPRTEMSGG